MNYQEYRAKKEKGLAAVATAQSLIATTGPNNIINFTGIDKPVLAVQRFNPDDGSALNPIIEEIRADELQKQKEMYQSLIADIDELLADVDKILNPEPIKEA